MKSSYRELEVNGTAWDKSLFNNNTTLNGYELLAIAIVNQAAEDYRNELKLSDKQGAKTQGAYVLERFFLSDYGDLLCFGMGELILEKLQKESITGRVGKTRAYFSPQRKMRGVGYDERKH